MEGCWRRLWAAAARGPVDCGGAPSSAGRGSSRRRRYEAGEDALRGRGALEPGRGRPAGEGRRGTSESGRWLVTEIDSLIEGPGRGGPDSALGWPGRGEGGLGVGLDGLPRQP